MRDIYAHAECNIAATSAKDSGAGLFFEREPLALQPFKIEISNSANRLFRSHRTHAYMCEYDNEDVNSQVHRQPLNTHAWVVQEAYLSPRIMHFTKSYLYWQCSESFVSERDQDEVPTIPAWRHRRADPRRLRSTIQPLCRNRLSERPIASESLPLTYTPEERETVYLAWCDFREEYTRRKLSQEEDRIVALLGIAEDTAEFFKSAFEEPYELRKVFVACLWKNYIIRELCWKHRCLNRSHAPPPAPLLPRAPTWSWASTNHIITSAHNVFGGLSHEYQSLAEVMDIQVDYQPNWVCSGSIRLKTRPMPVDFYPPDIDRQDNLRRSFVIDAKDDTRFESIITLDSPMPHKSKQTFMIVLLQRYRWLKTSQRSDDDWYYEGIGVAPSSTQTGTFERVGHFECYSSGPVSSKTPEQKFWHLCHKRREEFESRIITIV